MLREVAVGGAVASADAPGAEPGNLRLAKGGCTDVDKLRTGPLSLANHESLRSGGTCMS